jgi:hypothetical protein
VTTRSHFENLIDDLFAEHQVRRAKVTPRGDDPDNPGRKDNDEPEGIAGDDDEIHPSDVAILKAFRIVAKVLSAHKAEMSALRAEVTALKGGKPLQKAHQVLGGRMSGEEFMAKALEAQTAGRINALQVSIAETHLNERKAPPADIVRAVLTE